MLSLERGNPIAKVIESKRLGKKDGKSKYLGLIQRDDIQEDDSPGYSVDPYYLISEDELEKEVGTKKPKAVRKKMKELINTIKERVGKEFVLNDGKLQPVPNVEASRVCYYVSGPSGSGKSTFVSNFLDEYAEIYPKNQIVMFSLVPTDPAFARFESEGPKKTRNRMIRIVLNNECLEDIQNNEAIDEEDLHDSAVIFDDIDMITNKTMKEYVTGLRTKCLQIGRHGNITVLTTSHILCAGRETKAQVTESSDIVFFPGSGSSHQITYFLREYSGMSKEQITKVLGLPSRWVQFHNVYPQYVLYTDGCYLLS